MHICISAVWIAYFLGREPYHRAERGDARTRGYVRARVSGLPQIPVLVLSGFCLITSPLGDRYFQRKRESQRWGDCWGGGGRSYHFCPSFDRLYRMPCSLQKRGIFLMRSAEFHSYSRPQYTIEQYIEQN